jgi:hypothetical protein
MVILLVGLEVILQLVDVGAQQGEPVSPSPC